MSTGWVYVLGEVSGDDLKIGYTSQSVIQVRAQSVNRDQTTNASYVVLAGVRGTKSNEKTMRRAFEVRTDKGSRTEYVYPTPPVLEYVNWLRSQWYVTPDGTDDATGFPEVDPSLWMPNDDRRRPPPTLDPTRLIQDYESRSDHLGGTAWAWMVNPKASIQDYFTPVAIVNAAREAMGDIDLDAASHWIANQTHRIPDYFDVNRSAFDNRWYGRVWLNPPYGDNAPWYDAILEHVNAGSIEQLCMLSPMWAFTTGLARPVVEKASAFLLLSPTPTFWGNADGRTGTNQPHGIMYIGERSDRFVKAFREFGIPVTLAWELLAD